MLQRYVSKYLIILMIMDTTLHIYEIWYEKISWNEIKKICYKVYLSINVYFEHILKEIK